MKVSHSTTVDEVKNNIWEKQSVPVQEQHLVFDGKPMNPINTLSNHGVGPGESGRKMSKFFVHFCGAPLDLSNLPNNNEIGDLLSKSEKFPRFLPADFLRQLQESREFRHKDFSEGKTRAKWQAAGSSTLGHLHPHKHAGDATWSSS